MAIRFDKLTVKAQEAVAAAQTRAETLEHATIEPEHLLDALLAQEEGLIGPLLRQIGASPDAVRSELARILGAKPRVQGAQLHISPKLDAAFRQAQKEADQFKDEYVSTEHLLLGLAADDGATGKLLRGNGATRDAILK